MIRFFVCKDVSTLILNKTDEIQSTLSNMSEKTLKPSFIYSYAIFESTLTEILRYYLLAFPEKLDNNITLEKTELLSTSSTHDIILSSVNKIIRKYSCKTLLEYISFFKHSLSLELYVDENKIKKISQLRNSIIHDDAKSELLLLHIDQHILSPYYADVQNYILYFCNLLNDIFYQINNVYKKYTYERDFEKAVRAAADVAEKGDVVLLSPAAASFDSFRNFEKRGDFFCDIVRNL